MNKPRATSRNASCSALCSTSRNTSCDAPCHVSRKRHPALLMIIHHTIRLAACYPMYNVIHHTAAHASNHETNREKIPHCITHQVTKYLTQLIAQYASQETTPHHVLSPAPDHALPLAANHTNFRSSARNEPSSKSRSTLRSKQYS